MRLRFGRLLKNILSMVSLRGAEFLIGLVLLPYLVRVLGVDRFGALVFMQGVVRYGTVLVEYGFNLTGPRNVAQASSREETARVFSSIITCKLLIFLFITALAAVAVTVAGSMGAAFDAKLFWASYLLVMGYAVFPIWFFQGIQQMHYITIFNVGAQAIALVLILLFVRGPDDYILAALFLSCALPAAGVCSLVLLLKKFRYIFVLPSWRGIRNAFADGFYVFTSTVAINIYTTTNTVALGILTNDTVVGYFGAASRLIDCVKGLMYAFNQAVYPYVSTKLAEGRDAACRFIRKFLFAYAGAAFACGCVILAGGHLIVRIFFGQGYDESAYLLRLMAFLPAIIAVSNVYGIQVMLNFGLQGAFNRIICSGAVLDLILVVPLVLKWGGTGSALVMLAVESWISVVMFWYVERMKKIRIV